MDHAFSVETSGWLAVRCRGVAAVVDRPANQRIFAHSSPVYVKIAGNPAPCEAPARGELAAELERLLAWAGSGSRRERLRQILLAARQELGSASRRSPAP